MWNNLWYSEIVIILGILSKLLYFLDGLFFSPLQSAFIWVKSPYESMGMEANPKAHYLFYEVNSDLQEKLVK